ncbi:flagellar hook-associated protein 1 FlgK [Gammaproteobacteria bacterium]
MSDLFSISTSALFATSRALNTTSHNVANVNTPGYSRQMVELATKPSILMQGQYAGSGVNVAQIRRNYDDFLTTNLREITGRQSHTETLYNMASKVDNLLADPMAGLSPAVDDFFSSSQEVADDPTSIAARQNMLSNAETLVKRFNIQATRLDELDQYVNSQIETHVNEINNLASTVAKFNNDITVGTARGINTHALPNDLMDSRDEAVRQMAEKIGVNVLKQEDGTFNVFIANGQTLVTGTQTRFLRVQNNPYDQRQKEIALGPSVNITNEQNSTASKEALSSQKNSGTIISGQVTGGILGGLLQFRREVLGPAQNGLGRVATGITVEINKQHQLGMDLNNILGGELFDIGTPEVFPNTNNESDLQVTAEISDISALTTSDYQLTVMGTTGAGTSYNITKLSDGTTTTLNRSHRINDDGSVSLTLDPPVDGVTLILSSEFGSSGKQGDSFLIRPTRTAANKISLSINDPSRIAAATPIRASVAPGNIGSGKLRVDQVIDTTNSAFSSTGKLTPPILIRFDDPSITGGGLSYSMYDNTDPNYPVLLEDNTDPVHPVPLQGIPYDPARESSVFPKLSIDYGYRVTLSGTPKPGDSFTIDYNIGGKGDNRNMLTLTDLQSKQLLIGGTATFQGAYGQTVADVGVATRRANVNNDAEESLLYQAQKAQQEVAGVNLDEEAANLLKYQETYQAAAQLIATADTLFKTILGVSGR